MCVGALRPRPPRAALLLLGLVLGAAAELTCVGHTYRSGNRCCHECQPGYEMKSRCTDSDRDSTCSPCQPGFYNEYHNYDTCKLCTQCNHSEHPALPARCPAETHPKPQRGSLCLGVPAAPPSSRGGPAHVGSGGSTWQPHAPSGSQRVLLRSGRGQGSTGLSPGPCGREGHSVRGSGRTRSRLVRGCCQPGGGDGGPPTPQPGPPPTDCAPRKWEHDQAELHSHAGHGVQLQAGHPAQGGVQAGSRLCPVPARTLLPRQQPGLQTLDQLHPVGKAHTEAGQQQCGRSLRGQEPPRHPALGDPGPPDPAPHSPAQHCLAQDVTGTLDSPHRAPQGPGAGRRPGPGPGPGPAGPCGGRPGPPPALQGLQAAARCHQAPRGRQLPDPHPRGARGRPLHPGQDLSSGAGVGGGWGAPRGAGHRTPVTPPPRHLPCTVVGAPGLAPRTQLCMLCILPTQGGAPQ